MIVTLHRIKADLFGTHGQIEDEWGNVLCYTIERNDDKLAPVGIFNCVPHVKSNNGQHCWMLENVPGRTGILIHTGNTEYDSEGCIIIGLQANGEGVSESVLALQKLQARLPSTFTLRITND